MSVKAAMCNCYGPQFIILEKLKIILPNYVKIHWKHMVYLHVCFQIIHFLDSLVVNISETDSNQ